ARAGAALVAQGIRRLRAKYPVSPRSPRRGRSSSAAGRRGRLVSDPDTRVGQYVECTMKTVRNTFLADVNARLALERRHLGRAGSDSLRWTRGGHRSCV